jgi:DNA helicase II / ATP-dependent DNA helicase PcrA
MGELNDAQRAAVTHEGGPILVIAGAGTGKTKTLACRVAHLIEAGTAPDRILLLTFTRRSAQEMLTRVGKLVGDTHATRVWGGTYHAIASRLLRQHGKSIGLDQAFNVIDQEDSADLMDLVRNDLGLSEGEKRFPRKGTLAAIYSRVVNARSKLSDVLAQHFPWCAGDQDGIRRVFEAFTRRKRQQAVLDYDDLLLYWHAMLNVPTLGTLISEQFDHVLVDEYQDTNLVQGDILKLLRQSRPDVMAVGDDAQSIYSFRAATIQNMLRFPDVFPNTTVVKLEQNYRSVQPILDASNRVMSHAPATSEAGGQYAKTLRSDRVSRQKPRIVTVKDDGSQADEVCRRILAKVEEGIELRRQAVLFRTGHHSDALEVELARRNIPFVKYGGLKFVEAAHVKDMVALLRIVSNPADEMSWYRVLLLLEGVGPSAARKLMTALGITRDVAANLYTSAEQPTRPESQGARTDAAYAEVRTSDLTTSVLASLRSNSLPVPLLARDQFDGLRNTVLNLIEQKPTPSAVVERTRSFYEPIFQATYDNPQLRLRDLEQLEQIALGYASVQSFVTDLALDPPASAQDYAGAPLLDDDYLILSTIHSAKGCEWDIVHILHAADGNIPADMACGSDEEVAEERRLFYVAMTRARDELNIYFPLRYYFKKNGRSDRHSYAQLTRFIKPADMDLYEKVAAAGSAVTQPPTAPSAPVSVNVDAMLGDLWK